MKYFIKVRRRLVFRPGAKVVLALMNEMSVNASLLLLSLNINATEKL